VQILHGRTPGLLRAALAGRRVGTVFPARRARA
jgi:hypothetical protein